jgi:hypothetical protein
MVNKVALPPVMLPFLRDAAVTFWNYAFSMCDIKILNIEIEKGIEFLNIDGNICDCIISKLSDFWKGKKVFNCDDRTLENLSYGELKFDGEQISLKLGKKGQTVLWKGLGMTEEIREIIALILYGFARGFPFLKNRSTEKESPIAKSGKFHLFIEVWSHGLVIRGGMNIGRITNDIFLFTTDISQDREVISEFFRSDFNELRDLTRKVVGTFKGKLDQSPIIQDIIHERLLLEIVRKSLYSSISYAINWPSLRIYIKTNTSMISIDIPSSTFDLAKVAVLRSADTLGYSPSRLIKMVTQIIDNGLGAEHKVLNQMYILASSILQGNPDIELLYNLERAIKSESST